MNPAERSHPTSGARVGADPAPASDMLAPVTGAERIDSLDVLRGFALLGILVMNIQSFSMPAAAYMNPTAYGDLAGANLWVWILSHLFADQKFMTIFSALFGAGIVLMSRRAEARGGKAAGLHYRRTFWLMVLGLAHAYLLWAGDILFLYSVCALWVFWLRRRSPTTLFVVGAIVLLVSPALYLLAGYSVPYWSPEAIEQFAIGWRPSPEHIVMTLANYRGGFAEQMGSRVPDAIAMHTGALVFWGFWRASGLMLLGMGLFKLGFFSAELSRRVYRRCAVLGMIIGLPIVAFGAYRNFAEQWELSRFFLGALYNYFGSLLVSLAYAAGVMLVCQRAIRDRVTGALAAVGRMALTNYLLQTILATLVFYGHGLGYFGSVERVGQVAVVVLIWALQVPFSVWWLRRFRFGPFEWLWRTLAYMRVQPLRR